jgi:hypothetical protein
MINILHKNTKRANEHYVRGASDQDEPMSRLKRCMSIDERCIGTSSGDYSNADARLDVLSADDEQAVVGIGVFIDGLIRQSACKPQNAADEDDPFEVFAREGRLCDDPTGPEICLFISNVITEAGCTPECHVVALALVVRLVRTTCFQVTTGNWAVVFTSALSIAQKLQDDSSLANWDFVDVFHDVLGKPGSNELLCLEEFNQMEVFFLKKLQYRMQVSKNQYSLFMNELTALSQCTTPRNHPVLSAHEVGGPCPVSSPLLGVTNSTTTTQFFSISISSPLAKRKKSNSSVSVTPTKKELAKLTSKKELAKLIQMQHARPPALPVIRIRDMAQQVAAFTIASCF